LDTTTEERLIRPARNVSGSLRLPGDKSISHRYAMLGAFAEGTSRFTNFPAVRSTAAIPDRRCA
jgi:3-phosphoshikimate 1-carboxyvinyltransferase